MPASSNVMWPDELLAHTKSLYEGGEHSASQIGLVIGKSRNAVLGMAHRKKWINPNPRRGGRPAEHGEKRQRVRPLRIGGPNWMRPDRVPVIERPAEIPKPDNFLWLTIHEVKTGQCRFIDGDGPYFFCGQPVQAVSSYCGYHRAVCVKKPDGRPGQFIPSQF